MEKQAAQRLRWSARYLLIQRGIMCETNNCNLLTSARHGRAWKLQLQFCTARCTARRAHYLKYTVHGQQIRNNNKYIIRLYAKWRGLRIKRPLRRSMLIIMSFHASKRFFEPGRDSWETRLIRDKLHIYPLRFVVFLFKKMANSTIL